MNKILLASYGGGHVKIIAALTKSLAKQNYSLTIIGFTTAYRELIRQGIHACSVLELLDPIEDRKWMALSKPFIANNSHPDITPEETNAYFALGLRDLADKLGLDEALKKIQEQGRRAFEPIQVMQRYLKKTNPNIVVTTTSPRFELALLKAARQEGIPTLAIGDLFLIHERTWVLAPDYAENLAVISNEVANKLIADGFPPDSIKVTGNPAFDVLKTINENSEKRDHLRQQFGMHNKKVILYPSPPGNIPSLPYSFLEAKNVIRLLEDFCEKNPDYSYLIRPHPNHLFTLPENAKWGKLDDGSILKPEDAILVCDIVIFEISTMGLQAALSGKQCICIRFYNEQPFVEYGLALPAESLQEAFNILKSKATTKPDMNFGMPALGTATKNILNFIDGILTQKNNQTDTSTPSLLA